MRDLCVNVNPGTLFLRAICVFLFATALRPFKGDSRALVLLDEGSQKPLFTLPPALCVLGRVDRGRTSADYTAHTVFQLRLEQTGRLCVAAAAAGLMRSVLPPSSCTSYLGRYRHGRSTLRCTSSTRHAPCSEPRDAHGMPHGRCPMGCGQA